MNKFDYLLKYFPTGTAEGDRHFLNRAYISPDQLTSILSIPPGSPRVLVGNKGVGKTAILEWIFIVAKKRKIPVLLLTPDDFDTSNLSNFTDVASIKREMYKCLLEAVAVSIGTKLKGFLTGHSKVLYEEAVLKGYRDIDFGGKMLNLLSSISKPIIKIDGQQLATDLGRGRVSGNIIDSVQSYLLTEQKLFFLLIDDTDQVASLGTPQHLNRIWGLILAARKLTQTSPNIRCIVSLRSEIWMRLTKDDAGQRDQTDHINPLVIQMRAPIEYMDAILKRRLELAARDSGLKNSNYYEYFFENDLVTLPTSTARRSWSSFILKSARERPRDMIQFVNHLAKSAKQRGVERITDSIAESAMRDYSKERAEYLAVEVGEDCSTFLDVIRTFSELESFEPSFEVLRKHLEKIPSRFSLNVRGKVLQPQDNKDTLSLLNLLHEFGFINPKVKDTRRERDFRHITFLDDPHFVQMSRWNEIQSAISWDIHPAFRTYLIGIQREKRWC